MASHHHQVQEIFSELANCAEKCLEAASKFGEVRSKETCIVLLCLLTAERVFLHHRPWLAFFF